MSDPQGFCWDDSEVWIMVEYCAPRLGHSCSFFYYLGATPRGWRESQKSLQNLVPLFHPVPTPGFLVSWLFFCVQIFHQGDNLLWAASVGLVRSKEVPEMQRRWV